MPTLLPVTIPDVPTLATATLLLLQKPPGVTLASGVVRLTHTDVVPVIAAGDGFTVTLVNVEQPVASV